MNGTTLRFKEIKVEEDTLVVNGGGGGGLTFSLAEACPCALIPSLLLEDTEEQRKAERLREIKRVFKKEGFSVNSTK